MLLQVDKAHSDVPTVTAPSNDDHANSANQNENNPLVSKLLRPLIVL